MLRDSVIIVAIVVVRTHPQATLLAIITLRKSTHSPFCRYGGRFEFYCFKYLLWDGVGTCIP